MGQLVRQCAAPGTSIEVCAGMLPIPIGQLSPFGPWLQYPFGFFASERYCWW